MKILNSKFIVLSAVCASLIGLSAIASAAGPGRDKILSKISRLQIAKGHALAHHNKAKARQIQGQIDSLKALLNHHHH